MGSHRAKQHVLNYTFSEGCETAADDEDTPELRDEKDSYPDKPQQERPKIPTEAAFRMREEAFSRAQGHHGRRYSTAISHHSWYHHNLNSKIPLDHTIPSE